MSLKVSELGRYVKCPYSYYLEYVLGLKESDDGARELDAGVFSTLANAVLASFGALDGGRCTEPGEIRDSLRALLDKEVDARFGEHPRPAVRLQVELLRARLDAFAVWQAAWASEGWRIEHVEVQAPEGEEATFDVDGTTIKLSGRIDRIDYNEGKREWVILEYKTSDKEKTPEDTHRSKKAWIDFQLPMYLRIARALKIDGDIKVGYIALSRKADEVRAHLAKWGSAELLEADEAAREVVRSILKAAFWPPKPPSKWSPFKDRFESIVRATAPAIGGPTREVDR